MKKYKTVRGKQYAIHSPTEGNVQTLSGEIITSFYGSNQNYFVSPAKEINIPDDAVCVPMFPLLAEKFIHKFGNKHNLPSGYIPARFLENTGSQYIDSKLQTYSDSVISLTAQQVYSSNYNTGRYDWFFGSVKNPSMNIGFSIAEHEVAGHLGYVVIDNKGGNLYDFADKRLDVLNITNTETHFIINGETASANLFNTHAPVPDSEMTYPIFAYINSSAKYGINRGCRIFSFSDNTPSQGGNRLDLVAVIDPNGVPCMYDKITKKAFYDASTSEKDFIVGLTIEQARLLYKLPTVEEETLYISLPLSAFDADGYIIDADINSALNTAMANGWNFQIQYYEDFTEDYLSAYFLENTGSQYIDTKLQTYSDSVISITAQQVYSSNYNTGGFVWLYGSVQNPVSNIGFSVTEYRYTGILGYVVVGNRGGNMWDFADKRNDILNITNRENHFIINGEKAIPDLRQTHPPVPDSEMTYPIFGYINSSAKYGINKGCRIFSFSDNTPSQGGLRLDLVAAIGSDGVPCMFDKVSKNMFYNANTSSNSNTSENDFIVGLTIEQAKQLYKLPATGGTIRISLPSEVFDENGEITYTNINKALAIAEAKGWNFIIKNY